MYTRRDKDPKARKRASLSYSLDGRIVRLVTYLTYWTDRPIIIIRYSAKLQRQ